MTPENFCYWLQGFIEISDAGSMTPEQMAIVRDHLDLVFRKMTPVRKGEPRRDGGIHDIPVTDDLSKYPPDGGGPKRTHRDPSWSDPRDAGLKIRIPPSKAVPSTKVAC